MRPSVTSAFRCAARPRARPASGLAISPTATSTSMPVTGPDMGAPGASFRNYDDVLSRDSRARHASPLRCPTVVRRGRACPARHAAEHSAAAGNTSLQLRICVLISPAAGHPHKWWDDLVLGFPLDEVVPPFMRVPG